jgi:hypothetical protein
MSGDFVADGEAYEDNGRSNKRYLKFNSNRIVGLFNNEGDAVGKTVQGMAVNEKIVISQGFGVGYKKGLPLRFLSYMIPVLHLLKQLPQSATAEIYFAFRGGMRANGEEVPSEMALLYLWSRLVGRTSGLMLHYIDRFHPALANRVTVIDDFLGDVYPTDVITQLTESVQALYNEDTALRNFVDKRGGTEALRYMVEHSLYMRDPLLPLKGRTDWMLVPKMRLDIDHLVMVGGPAERIFHKVRQHLCRTIGIHSNWTSYQLWTPIGDPPTYNYQPNEPIWGRFYANVEEILGLYLTTPRASRVNLIRDFLILLADASGTEDFRVAKILAREVAMGKRLDTATLRALNSAWELIISF